MKIGRGSLKRLAFVLILSLVIVPMAPVFAQLGGVTPPITPPPVEIPPPAPAPVPTVTPPPDIVTPIITPPADTTAPAISGVANLSLAEHDATIVWSTDELAVSTLEYGTTPNYGSAPTLSVSALLAHTAILTGLNSGATYYYCLHATDLAGNVANSCGHTFTTASQTILTDTTPPDVTVVTVAPITSAGATINFTTNEIGNARVEYGTTAGYGASTNLDDHFALLHTVTLSNLLPNTLYHYRIKTSDELGNETITNDEIFTTETLGATTNINATDTTPPTISGVGTVTLGETLTTIVWNTNELAVSTLEYGTTPNYGSAPTLSVSALLAHTATLTGLSPNTTYYYCIHATDVAGNSASSCPHSFITGGTPDAPAETSTHETPSEHMAISTVETASVSETTATITWQTTVPADSQIEYGNSENLGSTSALDTGLTTTHTVSLTNLTPDTNYIFRVKSKPAGATLATASGNYEFNTLNQEIPTVPPANITAVSTESITSTAATITWTTDKIATSQVEYGISSAYGANTALNSTLSLSHGVALTNLEPMTTYHFRVKSIDEVSNQTFSEDYTFTTVAAPTGTTTADGTTAPTPITTVSIGGYDNASAELIWQTTSALSDLTAQYDIRYSTSPITVFNFDTATPAQLAPIHYGDVSPNETARAYIVAGLHAHTLYYFALKSKHQHSAYSDISNTVSATTTSGTSITTEEQPSAHEESPAGTAAPGGATLVQTNTALSISTQYGTGSGGASTASFEPTLIKAEPADSQIIFEWHNPGETNFVRTLIIKKEGDYPASPTDGQTIYEGRGNTFADTSLVNGTTYYYAFYSYNHGKIYSRGVTVSLAPKVGNTELKFNESGTTTATTPTLHFVHVWQKGNKDIEIEHLQELLLADNESYPEKYVTGYFGSLTESALKRFQKKHSLSPTGVVDASTQKELNAIAQSENKLNIPTELAVFNTNLRRGDHGQTIENLQQYLMYEGSYPSAAITGFFDKDTYNAVKKFQTKYNIDPISGFVGYKTRHRMQQLVGL